DAWRQIDFNANPLMSGLDLRLSGDVGSAGRFGSDFDSRGGRLQAALELDTPLDRLRERNDYREAQLGYQRARRDYMLFEDNVSQSLRNTLRIMDLAQLNFELRRSAVKSALAQVDLARLRLEEPPRPGQAAQIGATAARDLVSALSDLLSAQNEFLSLWAGNEVLRMVLDYELGLMQIDQSGHWVEPGPFTHDQVSRRLAQRSAPPEQLATASTATRTAVR
ncbi:MAG: TolC family protein, partial [Chthoniobacteraceae bacterium]